MELMTLGFSDIDKQDEFLEYYPNWIASSQLNSFRGLENFPYRFVSLGCTQALDEFHDWCKRKSRTIRMFRGEYPYNRDCIDFDWDKDFIDDRELAAGDAVIISAPFSGSGDIHPRWSELLGECEKKDIPVMVDCAFFGTCAGIEIDLDHPSIVTVAFSTTKGLSCGNWRNGIAFSRIQEGHLSVQTEWHHGIHLNVALGLELMKKFSPDFLVNKYKAASVQACEILGLSPTPCVHLATGGKDWSHFSRDGAFNRIGLKNAAKEVQKLTQKGKSVALSDFEARSKS